MVRNMRNNTTEFRYEDGENAHLMIMLLYTIIIASLAFVVLATLDPSYPAYGHLFLRAHLPHMQGSGRPSGFETTINELLLHTKL